MCIVHVMSLHNMKPAHFWPVHPLNISLGTTFRTTSLFTTLPVAQFPFNCSTNFDWISRKSARTQQSLSIGIHYF